MILTPSEIEGEHIISPFQEKYKRNGVSGGISHAGYDVAVRERLILWPGRFVLASTLESFHMPDDVVGMVHDKSTWARLGVAVQNTVIEPGWIGYLTLELTLHSFRFLVIPAHTPIAQVMFHRMSAKTDRPYSGKYQYQGREPVRAIRS